MDHLRTSTVSDSFPISPKHVVEHCHIDRRVSIAHFSDDSAQPVAPDQSADAYSAIPMDNAATISSLVSVIFLRTHSSGSVPVARPATSRKPIRWLNEETKL